MIQTFNGLLIIEMRMSRPNLALMLEEHIRISLTKDSRFSRVFSIQGLVIVEEIFYSKDQEGQMVQALFKTAMDTLECHLQWVILTTLMTNWSLRLLLDPP